MAKSKAPTPEWLKNKEVISVVELAKEHSVTKQAVRLWFRRNNKRMYRHKNKLYVWLSTAAEYGESRAKRRPVGWYKRKALAEELEPNNHKARYFLRLLEERGKIRCKRFRGVVYIHPDDVAYAMLAYKSILPPDRDWILTADLARQVDRTRKAVRDWCTRNDIPCKWFRHPIMGHPCPYIYKTDADRYRELVQHTAHNQSR